MFRSRSSWARLLWAGAAFAMVALPARAEDVMGEVSAVVGSALAERPDGSTRPLACGDPVLAGERVLTSRDGGVGLLMGDSYAHVSGDSALRLDRSDRGQARLDLESGGVRVVDARDAGTPLEFSVLGAGAELVGNDTEAHVLAEKIGRYALLCEYDAPLVVRRSEERADAGPGDCVIAKSREPLYTARAHPERIPLAGLDACDPPVVALGPVSDRFGPDVAAPPIVASAFPGPLDVLPSPLDACEDPGTGCGGIALPDLGLGTNPFHPELPPGAGHDLGLGTNPFHPGLPPGAPHHE